MIKLASLKLANFKQYEKAEIDFPDQGRILIKGKNEAGKSTIFEAIVFALFGEPIYVGNSDKDNRNLIRFNADSTTVELIIKTDEKRIKIKRTLSTRNSQSCSLTIESLTSDTTPVFITKVKQTNERIIKEIGIDKKILVNTCFVGQKKIGSLEDLKPGERQEIISKLFNLEYLGEAIELAKDNRKKYKDEIETYEIIKKAGEAKKELPQIEKELQEIQKRKLEIEKIEKAKEILSKEEAIKNLSREIETLEEKAKALEKEVERFKKYREEEKKLEEIFNIKGNIQNFEEQKTKIEERIKDLEEIIKNEPSVKEKLKELEKGLEIKNKIEELKKELSDLTIKITKLDENIPNLKEKASNLKELLEKTKSIADKKQEIDSLDKERESIEQRQKILREREEKINNILPRIKNLDKEEDAIQKAIVTLSQIEKVNNLKNNLSKNRKNVISVLILLIASLILTFSLNSLFILLALCSLIFLVSFYRTYSKIRSNYEKESGRLEDSLEALPENLKNQQEELLKERLSNIQTLRRKKQEQIERIVSKIEEKIESSNKEIISKREEKAKLEAELRSLIEDEKRAKGLMDELSNTLKCARDLSHIEESINKLEALYKKYQSDREYLEKNISQLKGQDLFSEKNLSDLSLEKGSLDAEIKKIDEAKKEVEKEKKDYENIINNLTQLNKTLGEKTENFILPSPEYLQELKEKIKELENKNTEENSKKANEELHRKKGAKDNLEKIYNSLIEEFIDKFKEENWKELAFIDIGHEEKESINLNEKDLLQKKGEMEGIIKEFELKTGRKREELDPEKVEKNYRNLEKNMLKMDYAVKIIESIRESILKAVLPRTMAFMQKFLPILTADRYHYAEIDEDYKLKVYTNYQSTPIEKNLFSGGTQDQLSLALRLAFAMATLPQNKGVQPGFIFLDEPLGSFDEERGKALVQLLTQGEIAEYFDQIFVITHIPIEESLFDEIIYIENGKIIRRMEDFNQALDF
ncbi:MAG: SMC family ATPase [Dictyoglomaceae bacterium]|nr:SMC family ATPase [Dictyoglomaceae bacterium]HPU43957.1 SMC family ATPase [Dictyoglomaceae bacterium]